MRGLRLAEYVGAAESGITIPTYMYALETMALIEKQQKVQVCENDLVRRIMTVKAADKRRMDELRVEIGVYEEIGQE